MSKGFSSVDLDQLLVMARRKGCACDKLFEGPCLAHYVEQVRRRRTESQEAYGVLKKKLEDEDAHPDRSARAEDSPGGGWRFDAAVRGDRRGDGNRTRKVVQKPARKR